MITKRHHVSLYINGTEAELFSQEDLNLRINNVIYDPSKISTSTAEYSFSFNLPKSRVNNQIFDNANVHSKKGKFGKNYSCEVYADGILIFNGTLRIKTIESDKYKCNLVSIKQNKIEDIFGDHKMNELRWLVPFVGINSINVVNQNLTNDYFFPFVCYGAFQKEPENTYGDVNVYTSKYDLDKTLLVYQETFPPSPKITTLVRKLFGQYGYNADGDIFSDDIANNIYLSEYLKDDQDPAYNLGSSLGKCTVNFEATNARTIMGGWSHTSGLEGTLTYGYVPNNQKYETKNFDKVDVYDIWSMPTRDFSLGGYATVSTDNPWMFRDNCIVIPSTGLYKVTLSATVALESDRTFKAGVYSGQNDDLTEITVRSNNIFGMTTPVELQIVRNDNAVELIHGYDGTNKSVYPHEAGPEYFRISTGTPTSGSIGNTATWYVPKQYQMMQYDPYVNPNFICGFSSIGYCFSFMKNYNSWATGDGLVTTQFQCMGYDAISGNSDGSGSINQYRSDYHQQNSIGAPANNFSRNSDMKYTARVSGIIYLERNDIIMAKALVRKYMDSPNHDSTSEYFGYDINNWYGFNITNGVFTIEALSPNETYATDVSAGAWGLPCQFDSDLNIGNFLNADEKISDFVNNFVKAFNLSVTQDGNTIFLNKQNQDLSVKKIPVKLDDRVDMRDVEAEPIEYPKSMQVSYNIDEEEAGFYYSVPEDHINDTDWKDWADRGSDKVILNEYDDTADDETVSLSNSYCWYHDFNLHVYSTDPGHEDVETWTGTVSLPIISKDEWMIDNYKMEESMENDGKGQRQRWWFRYPADNQHYIVDRVYNKPIYLAIPKNTNEDGLELSYKNKENTLLTRYFNILAMPESNLVNIEAYITPEEYTRLKGGAPIQVDNDIYITCEIKGYDPTGNNTTEIIAMKKI